MQCVKQLASLRLCVRSLGRAETVLFISDALQGDLQCPRDWKTGPKADWSTEREVKDGMSTDHSGSSQTCCGLFVTPLLYLQDQSERVRCGLTSSKQRSEIGCVLAFLGRGLLIVPDTGANGAQTYWHILKDSHQPPYTDKRDWPKEGWCLNKLLQDIVWKLSTPTFIHSKMLQIHVKVAGIVHFLQLLLQDGRQCSSSVKSAFICEK